MAYGRRACRSADAALIGTVPRSLLTGAMALALLVLAEPAAARNPMQLRGGLTLDDSLTAGLSVGLEQVAPWRARLDLGVDLSPGGGADVGFGVPIGEWLTVDLTVGGGKRGDDPTWRVRLPVGLAWWARLEIAPEYGDRGFGVAARLTVPLTEPR